MSGPRKAAPGVASCARISIASSPPMAKNTNDATRKRMPSWLWLTEASVRQPRPVAHTRDSAAWRRSGLTARASSS